jgi:hypothetical protein
MRPLGGRVGPQAATALMLMRNCVRSQVIANSHKDADIRRPLFSAAAKAFSNQRGTAAAGKIVGKRTEQ